MDPLEALAFARALIDIDSTTGTEARAGEWLAARLTTLGYSVTRQPVAGDRFNVIATLDPPDVVLSTHYDCVPPFFPSHVGDGKLYGRGSCDAKGILAAQVAAAGRMRADGHRRVGLLFVVGEERGSDGAAAANAVAAGSKFLVNGEPTDSRLAAGTRGILRVRLHAKGRAGHSSAPEHFESAIEKLVDALVRLRTLALPSNPTFGATSYSVGLIEGGVAPNVVPARASAEVMFRTVGDAGEVLDVVKSVEPEVAVEEVLRVPPVRLHTIPGFAAASFPFTTDIPLLDRWGVPLLFGPGSFLVAHTDDEHLDLAEFDASISSYTEILAALEKR
ncbi:MAG TPA: M20/M25/M40 family metallo-hydrolase [Vicinamibacterales bacterium]|nr:M20/M25/M40 family metallo-hydrolase [Vicinamibacterales bacterium]